MAVIQFVFEHLGMKSSMIFRTDDCGAGKKNSNNEISTEHNTLAMSTCITIPDRFFLYTPAVVLTSLSELECHVITTS